MSSPAVQAVEQEVFDMIKTIGETDLNIALGYVSSIAAKNISADDRKTLLNIVGVLAGTPAAAPTVPSS